MQDSVSLRLKNALAAKHERVVHGSCIAGCCSPEMDDRARCEARARLPRILYRDVTSKTRLDYFLTIRLSAFPRQISDYYSS